MSRAPRHVLAARTKKIAGFRSIKMFIKLAFLARCLNSSDFFNATIQILNVQLNYAIGQSCGLKGLELLLEKSVLEEHHNWFFGAIDILIFTHADHGLGVHGFAGEELHVLKPAQQFLHNLGDIGLEALDFSGFVVVLEILDNLLHVTLKVVGKGLFVGEARFDEPVVKDYVNAGLGSLVGAFISFLSRCVRTLEDHFSVLAGFVLEKRRFFRI